MFTSYPKPSGEFWKPEWEGECIMANEGLTPRKVYKITENIRSNAPMRPVKVMNDCGEEVQVFAARFTETVESYSKYHRTKGE